MSDKTRKAIADRIKRNADAKSPKAATPKAAPKPTEPKSS